MEKSVTTCLYCGRYSYIYKRFHIISPRSNPSDPLPPTVRSRLYQGIYLPLAQRASSGPAYVMCTLYGTYKNFKNISSGSISAFLSQLSTLSLVELERSANMRSVVQRNPCMVLLLLFMWATLCGAVVSLLDISLK